MNRLGIFCIALLLCCGAFGAEPAADPIVPPVTAATVTPPELITQAQAHIAKLNSENFDERDAASRTLSEMDIRLLPWLRKLLDDDKQTKKLDVDVRSQLGTVIKALQEKNELAVLRYGTLVKLDCKQELVSKIIDELERQSENPDLNTSLMTLPANLRIDFKFDGIFWDALLQLQKQLPLTALDKRESFIPAWPPRRDTSGKDAHLLSGAVMGVGIGGIGALRVARVAWEADANGRFLSFIVVPHLEPRFKPQGITLQMDAIVLDNGTRLTPLENTVALTQQGSWYNIDSATFAAAVKDELKNCKTATLALTAEYDVFENRLVRQDITQGAGPFKLLGGVTLNVTKAGENYTVRLEGTGGVPRWDTLTNANFYDAGGTKLISKVGGSRSSSSGNATWNIEYTCTVPGVVTQVEVTVPMKRPKVKVPVEIKNVPLPFTPAPLPPPAPDAKPKSSDK